MADVQPLIMGEIGSIAHGLGVPESDHDYIAVYADPPEGLIGLSALRGAFKVRDRAEGVKSEPGDTEIVYYGLRKFVSEIVKGNPTLHTLLFTPNLAWPDTIGLQAFAPNLLSRQIAVTHVGYANGMYDRLTGVRAPRTNRPELIAKHGYDTKAAFHAIRLLIQGHEMLTHQTMTMPMHDLARDFLLSVRNGELSEARALEEIVYWRERIEEAGQTSKLPLRPDMDVVNDWLVNVHRRVWYFQGAQV
ncbi:nucleotidyltransferase [Mycobacterium phage Krypton555]|uniref:Nucleotidyltransferase n=1 Tax=Mycobacterium phage Krypton555 TaxID=2015885 RepID=A0A222ZRY5_9CAUD|nr:nucleotidyltransferase [Mycobacterium phage Krypton555]ASR87072.1 nucleotidyltransferase [Mycobacterium phage Krypton555]